MRLKNIVIVVKDLEKSKNFYKNLFGLDVILEQEGNVMLTEGLVLQERTIWESCVKKDILSKNHATELYFEEPKMEEFLQKLNNYSEKIEYVTECINLPWNQKLVRFYDLDGNLIEVRTPC